MSDAPVASAEEIQRQMRAVRSELRDDVREIVANARVMADWHYYVQTYPWLCVGAAAAAGYLLVPSRVTVVRPDSRELAELVSQHQVAVKAEVKPQPAVGVLGSLINMATGAALQGAMAVASYQLDQLFKGWKSGSGDRAGDSEHEESHR
ncbi:MAG TPA: hypothetical protein VMP01_08510 [Pirellulaceae bacterium]|nr:hypothetical protein [Pirellulaceae bacterium]